MAVQKAYKFEFSDPSSKDFGLWEPRQAMVTLGRVKGKGEFVEYKRGAQLVGRVGVYYSREIDYEELEECFKVNFQRIFSPYKRKRDLFGSIGSSLGRSANNIPSVSNEESLRDAHNEAVAYATDENAGEYGDYEVHYRTFGDSTIAFQEDSSDISFPYTYKYGKGFVSSKIVEAALMDNKMIMYPATDPQDLYNTVNNSLDIAKIERISKMPTAEQKAKCSDIVDLKDLGVIDALVAYADSSVLYALMLELTERHRELIGLQSPITETLYHDAESYVDSAYTLLYKPDESMYAELKFLEDAWCLILERLDANRDELV